MPDLSLRSSLWEIFALQMLYKADRAKMEMRVKLTHLLSPDAAFKNKKRKQHTFNSDHLWVTGLYDDFNSLLTFLT